MGLKPLIKVIQALKMYHGTETETILRFAHVIGDVMTSDNATKSTDKIQILVLTF